MGRGRTSRPNPHLGDISWEQSVGLWEIIWRQHRAQHTCLVGAIVYPVPADLPQTPGPKHSSHHNLSHQERHSLTSLSQDSLVSSKMKLNPRPLPSGSFHHMDRMGLRSIIRACSLPRPFSLLVGLSLWLLEDFRQCLSDCASRSTQPEGQPPTILSPGHSLSKLT